MALNAGTAWIAVRPNPTGWTVLKKSLAIAAPLAAIGAGALAVGNKFHEMRSAIITGTGASGKALESLETSAKNVGKNTPEDFKKVGEAIAEMNTATGATGKPLEDMTKAVLDASRLLGEDGVQNSKAFGRALNQWNIPAKDGAKTVDTLFKATQDYGIGLGETTKNLSKYGGTLQNAGFTMEESVSLFGRLSKGGVDLRRAMPGLNQAFRKWAEEGKNSKKELAKAIGEIKNAESGTKALAIAQETFGAEGAQQIVSGARSGGLSLKGLSKDLEDSEGSVKDADKRNRTFGESWQLLKNKAMAGVEPLATRIFDALIKGMNWLNSDGIPTLKNMSGFVKNNSTAFTVLGVTVATVVSGLLVYRTTVGIVTKVTAAWNVVQKLLNGTMRANPIGIVITVLAALVAGLVVAYKKSDTFRKIVDGAWKVIQKAASVAWNRYYKPILKALWGALQKTWGFFQKMGSLIGKAWNGIKKAAGAAVRWLVDKVLWMAEKVLAGAVKAFGWAPGIGKKLKDAHKKVRGFRADVNRELGNIKDEPVKIKLSVQAKKALKAVRGAVSSLKGFFGGSGGAGTSITRGARHAAGAMGGGGPIFGATTSTKGLGKLANATGTLAGTTASGLGAALSKRLSNVVKRLDSIAPGGKRGKAGRVLPRGSYSIGMPYLGYPGHYGADYPAPIGTPVSSPWTGVVSSVRHLGYSYGNHIKIRHPGGRSTLYAHLSSTGVGAGQAVAPGQRIGAVGSTGNSTGPHLHFEARRKGRRINPASLGIFDGGGELSPGMLAYHSANIRKPDKVLTDQQFRDIHTLAMGATNRPGRPEVSNQFTVYQQAGESIDDLSERLWFKQRARG